MGQEHFEGLRRHRLCVRLCRIFHATVTELRGCSCVHAESTREKKFVLCGPFVSTPFRCRPAFWGSQKKNPFKQRGIVNDLAFRKVRTAIQNGKQVLVFVHSRKDTVNTARALRELASKASEPELFDCSQTCKNWSELKSRVAKSKDRNVYDLFTSGLGCHHAGLLRQDRNLTERIFAEGAIKVLVCTATLAWV